MSASYLKRGSSNLLHCLDCDGRVDVSSPGVQVVYPQCTVSNHVVLAMSHSQRLAPHYHVCRLKGVSVSGDPHSCLGRHMVFRVHGAQFRSGTVDSFAGAALDLSNLCDEVSKKTMKGALQTPSRDKAILATRLLELASSLSQSGGPESIMS